MRFTVLSLILPLVVSVAAISVTEPTKGEEVDPSAHFTVKWSTVSTDPNTVDIYVVNNAIYPSIEKKVASDINTSEGSYTVKDVSGLSVGPGYQINLVSHSGLNTGILAQSMQFNVTDPTSSSSSTTSNPESTTTSSSTHLAHRPTTSTSPTTSTASSTASSSPSASGKPVNGSKTGSSAPTPTPNAASAALVSPLTAAVVSFAALLIFAW